MSGMQVDCSEFQTTKISEWNLKHGIAPPPQESENLMINRLKSINNGVASGFLWQSRPTSGSWQGDAELTCSFMGKDLGTARIIWTDYDNFIVVQKCNRSWAPSDEGKFRQMVGIHVRNPDLTQV